MVLCEICQKKPAVENCSQCGMPLCKDHIEHGIQFRTNEPVISCPNCKKKSISVSKNKTIIFGILILVIIIVVLWYLNSIFGFLR